MTVLQWPKQTVHTMCQFYQFPIVLNDGRCTGQNIWKAIGEKLENE